MRDSAFIKKIKWPMKLVENSTIFDVQKDTPFGYALEIQNQVDGIIYEADAEILQRMEDEEDIELDNKEEE